MSQQIADAKRALRAEIRERRRIRTSAERSRDESALTTRIIALVERCNARSISAYLSLPDEPPTRAAIAELNARGVRVLLPVSRDDGLLDWAVYTPDREQVDALGLPTPAGEVLSPMAINDVDLMIIPAAAVDRVGMRLGWGRGYFDKTLGSMNDGPAVCAVVFDDEVVEHVPNEVHDIPVSGVLTPTRFIDFSVDS